MRRGDGRGSNTSALEAVGAADPARLSAAAIDVADTGGIDPFLAAMGKRRFDVIFSDAGTWGAGHQSVAEASDAEFAEVMLTSTFGPVRLAHRVLGRLAPGGTYRFMSSHRGSLARNVEGGLEFYRASKAALNMLARGSWAANQDRKLAVLLIQPGWVRTEMGTLGGTMQAEIEPEPSVQGVAEVVGRHMGSGENLYLDRQDEPLAW